MAVIRERQQFRNKRIGVVRADTGEQEMWQAVGRAADNITAEVFKVASDKAKRLGTDLATQVSQEQLRTINPETGRAEAPHRTSLMTQTIKGQGDLSYRDEAWKLILKRDGQPHEFYNLEQDPFETDDLMANPEFSAKIQQMHRNFLKLNPKGLIHLDSNNIKKKKKK